MCFHLFSGKRGDAYSYTPVVQLKLHWSEFDTFSAMAISCLYSSVLIKENLNKLSILSYIK